MEGKGVCECQELLKNSLLEAQEQSIPYQGKGGRQDRRPPCLNKELVGVLKSKKYVYQLRNGSQISFEDYKNLARSCRGEDRKG